MWMYYNLFNQLLDECLGRQIFFHYNSDAENVPVLNLSCSCISVAKIPRNCWSIGYKFEALVDTVSPLRILPIDIFTSNI